MMPLTQIVGFCNVSELARVAGCDFEVLFDHSLWDWCQESNHGEGLWSKAGGLLCSLSCISLDELKVGGLVRLKSAGQKILVELAWQENQTGQSLLVASLPTGADDSSSLPKLNPTGGATEPSQSPARQLAFYFVCRCCDAKWFAETNLSRCPRCQTQSVSNEAAVPPWWKHRACCLPASTLNQTVPMVVSRELPEAQIAKENGHEPR